MGAAYEGRRSIHIRGEGGAVLEVPLPLSPGLADRLASGAIRQVNPDGSPFAGEAETPPESVGSRKAAEELEQARQENTLREEAPEPPGRGARKADWVDYAVSTGTITKSAAQELTVAELMERYGAADDSDGGDT